MTRALHIPLFRRLLAAYALNELAWSVGTLALSLLVYRRTASAYGSAAFFVCALVLPAMLSPMFVAHLDQRRPRRVLPGLYAIEAVLFAALAWMTSRFSLVPVLVVALADGTVAAAARALARAATAEVLTPADLLHEGNAVSNAAFSIAFMLGPAVGGAVVVAGGTVAALLANCGLFAITAVVLATARLPDREQAAVAVKGRLKAGLVHVRGDRPVFMLLSLQAGGLVFFTISVPVEVVFAQRSLHAGAGGYGALLSAWGVGAVLGSAVYARWSRRSARLLITGGAASLGLGFAVMAAAPSIEVAVVGAALGGLSNGLEMVAARTAIQERTSEHWMALVMSLNDSVTQLTPGIGFLLGGTLTALTGPRLALAVASAGSFGFTVVAWILLRPSGLPPVRVARPRPPTGRAARSGSPAEGAPGHPASGRQTPA